VTETLATRIADLEALVGQELGPSRWLEIDQARIDAFAECTEDPQWIHTDPVRAAAGPFGATVAHGFLTLSLLVRLLSEVLQVEDAELTVNYGLDRVRFPAPVRAGERLRARFRVAELTETPDGAQAKVVATAETGEDAEKPACVAELILRFMR
jgi:acyl dehydratase